MITMASTKSGAAAGFKALMALKEEMSEGEWGKLLSQLSAPDDGTREPDSEPTGGSGDSAELGNEGRDFTPLERGPTLPPGYGSESMALASYRSTTCSHRTHSQKKLKEDAFNHPTQAVKHVETMNNQRCVP